ncbi:hypothetical protein B0H16DRAFT_1490827 [Mycena metata]|uniref:Uncharacterized protein n=1 Tax=Mycena metata TaxID=1033252 RepID=A0AAD7KIR7_9AGAR|nr:hypothetical protein B0H16DRAFT_1490827 [Mycena metata]
MSFQHFRLSEAIQPHLVVPAAQVPQQTSVQQFQTANTNNTFPTNAPVTSGTKQPYGSGDTDDGYTLVFPSLESFHEWRNLEEETKMVEFVKGDTHGSKAVPPRFKDHTKLVCARHSRSGRKKYVKKHPERVRKVPSRKLDGEGCSASISFKTYYDTEEVRAYVAQHSHEIGLANLPFTRRGRKAAAQQEKEKPARKQPKLSHGSSPGSTAAAASSTSVRSLFWRPYLGRRTLLLNNRLPCPTPPQYKPQSAPSAVGPMAHERWENMATLFESVRGHARTFEYPSASVAALETVLIRLYLESPVTLGSQTPAVLAAQPSQNVVQSAIDPNIQPNLGEDTDASGSDDG